jgi:peptide subunit release factor 1 (eRF1)
LWHKENGMKTALTRIVDSLQALQAMNEPSVPILSVYLNLLPYSDETRTITARLRDQLKPLEALTEKLDHDAAASLRVGIARALEMAPSLEAHRGNGWALFVCDELDLEEVLILPPRVWDCAMAGPRPYLRPLRAAIDEFRRVATVVLDARKAEITVSYVDEILDHRVIEGEIVRKSNRGGWHGLDERRNRGHADEVRHRLWGETAETLALLHRDMGIEIIFVGGQQKVTDAFVNSLPPEIGDLVGGTFAVDVHMLTEGQLMEIVGSLEEAHERQEEVQMVADAYAARAADEPAAIGIDQVLRGVNQSAVAHMFIQQGAVVEGRACRSCGSLQLADPVCAACGTDTVAIPDLLEAMVHEVVTAGGLVEHVVADTGLVSDMVAAKLRVPMW